MAIFANEHIGIHINTFGAYEAEALDLLFEFLEPLAAEFSTGLALDIGANVGNHAIAFARRFAAVVAFEPHPDICELLRFNTRRLGNVTVHNIGLGDQSAELQIVEVEGNLGRSSLGAAADESSRLTAPVRRLDELALDRGLLRFIKVDVEGLEEEVLLGALQTIRSAQPIVVLEQNQGAFSDSGTSQPLEILSALGYSFCWLDQPYESMPLIKRRLLNIRQLIFGGVHKLMSGSMVPAGTYSMVIAVPARLRGRLKVA